MRTFVSIREATKHIYPNINSATIHQWMSKKVFKPYIYKARPTGPHNGCKLNHADLVTIGLFHELLKCGAQFDDLRFDKNNPRLVQNLLEQGGCRYYVIASHSATQRIELYFFEGSNLTDVGDAISQIEERERLGHAIVNCNALCDHVTGKLKGMSNN